MEKMMKSGRKLKHRNLMNTKYGLMETSAFVPTELLLPGVQIEHREEWGTIACDQFTSYQDYWDRAEEFLGPYPSTYHLILPEIYLDQPDVDQRIERAHKAMDYYLDEAWFSPYPDSMMLIRRTLFNNQVRCGILGAIDLEEYDYTPGSKSLVRPTEATVVERIPPRMKMRRGASLETSHIMLLIDDPENTVFRGIDPEAYAMQRMYRHRLLLGGNKIEGYMLRYDQIRHVCDALLDLQEKGGETPLLFAVGDGNHSLATAKAYYEDLKKKNPDADMATHPARYAMVELINLHDPTLVFEAIHRAVMETDTKKLLADMTAALKLGDEGEQSFVWWEQGERRTYHIGAPTSHLTVGSVQNFLDAWLQENGGKIDYIHGTVVLDMLTGKESAGTVGLELPDMNKFDLFPAVQKDGVLPRKTFSMGRAEDKRFYYECRALKRGAVRAIAEELNW